MFGKRSRREWVLQGGSLVASPFLSSAGIALAGIAEDRTKKVGKASGRLLLLATSSPSPMSPLLSLIVFHHTDGRYEKIELPKLKKAHSTVLNPVDRNQILVIPKYVPKAYIVDIRTGAVVRKFLARSSKRFYGHGVFSPDGKYVYLTEAEKGELGQIGIFEAHSGKAVGKLPVYGANPHEVKLDRSGGTFIIANKGYAEGSRSYGSSPSCLSYVEVKSGKLLDKVELKGPGMHINHFAVTKNGDIAMGINDEKRDGHTSNRINSLVAIRKGGQEIKVLQASKAELISLGSRVLSIDYDIKNGIIGATNPDRGAPLSFWSNNTLVKMFKNIKGSSGINFLEDRGIFVVTTHKDGIYEISSPSLKVVSHKPYPGKDIFVIGHSTVV